LLVAPIYIDSQNKDIYLPEGKWRYFFNDKEVFEGKQKINKDFPLDEFPVFVKEGAIIPMNIERDYSGFGTKENKGYITFLIYPAKENSFDFYHLDKPDIKTTLSYTKHKDNLEIVLEGEALPHILNICLNKAPENVLKNGKELQKDIDWFYNPVKEKLIIMLSGSDIGRYEIN
jgi:alpha-D-xyloside xylohydrolase